MHQHHKTEQILNRLFGPQGYNQSHQPQQRMNQAPQSGIQGVPNQAPNQWGQPAPQGWNQGPQPQNMQRQQQWGGPQSMPPRQGMQSQRPEMVSHPAPAQMNQPEAEKTPSENKFSFNDFHQRDNQTKQQDFAYGIDLVCHNLKSLNLVQYRNQILNLVHYHKWKILMKNVV